jgi:hypothetical protein
MGVSGCEDKKKVKAKAGLWELLEVSVCACQAGSTVEYACMRYTGVSVAYAVMVCRLEVFQTFAECAQCMGFAKREVNVVSTNGHKAGRAGTVR